MPRTKEQNDQIRRQRKEAILDGALQVYAEKGYAGAEIGDVADRAGVARGLVYYYFKDKMTLYRELFHYMLELSKESTASHFRQEGAVLKLLQTYLADMYDGMLEHPEYVLFFFRMRHDLRELFTAEELQNWKWRLDMLLPIKDILERGMQEGVIRPMNAGMLLSQFWGAAMHGLVYGQQRLEELKKEGKTKDEIAAAILPDLRDAVANCMAMVVA